MKNHIQILKDQTGVALSQKTKRIIQNLEPFEQKIVLLALDKKICDVRPEVVIDELITIITTAYAITSQKPENDQLFLFADELYNRLLTKFPRVTLEEIKLAIKNGVYGEYGEYFGLNPKSFLNFVEGYCGDPKKVNAIGRYLNAEAEFETKKELTDEEKEQSKRSFCNALFADYLAGKLRFEYIPSLIYDYLEVQGLLRLSRDEKKVIYERAKATNQPLSTSETICKNLGEVTPGTHNSGKQDNRVKTISKQLAVLEYFKRMENANKDLIFNDKN